MRAITSLQHPIVKHFVKLRNSRAYRKEVNTALIVGTKLVQELSALTSFKTFIIEEGAQPLSVKAEETFSVTPGILKKISGVDQPEPYAAEIFLPAPANLKGKKRILAFDGISDPGNLGTLLRSALALGWDGAFIVQGSADPFNEKALRAAKGATFHIPICEGSSAELQELIEKESLSVYIADMDGKRVEEQEIREPLILIMGSESHGVRFNPKEGSKKVAIPMDQKMESLNVAVAGSILMYLIGSKQ